MPLFETHPAILNSLRRTKYDLNRSALGAHHARMQLTQYRCKFKLARPNGYSHLYRTTRNWTLGNRLVRAEDIERLAGVYGCSADSLFVSPEQGAQREADDLLANLRIANVESERDAFRSRLLALRLKS